VAKIALACRVVAQRRRIIVLFLVPGFFAWRGQSRLKQSHHEFDAAKLKRSNPRRKGKFPSPCRCAAFPSGANGANGHKLTA